MKALRSRLSEIDQLRAKLEKANDQNRTMELVQHLISASQSETEELLREGRSITELATMVTTMKRELRNSNTKRAQIRSTAEDLNRQLKACKEEKSYVAKLEIHNFFSIFVVLFLFIFHSFRIRFLIGVGNWTKNVRC